MADKAEIIQAPQTEITPPDPTLAAISMLERAAVNKDVDPEKLIRLYDLHERMQDKAAEKAFYAAMSAMQPHLPVVEHTKEIRHKDKLISTYTPWEDIDEQIRPIYTEYGFSLSFEIQQEPDRPIIVTANVMHEAGHMTKTAITLPADSSGAKNSVQQIGSTVKYGMRYAACAALNVTTRGANGETEDDDGREAGKPMSPAQAKKHLLWETLRDELKTECLNRQEAQDWMDKTKQYRKEYRQMPDMWKVYFYYEEFQPFIESLPEERV